MTTLSHYKVIFSFLCAYVNIFVQSKKDFLVTSGSNTLRNSKASVVIFEEKVLWVAVGEWGMFSKHVFSEFLGSFRSFRSSCTYSQVRALIFVVNKLMWCMWTGHCVVIRNFHFMQQLSYYGNILWSLKAEWYMNILGKVLLVGLKGIYLKPCIRLTTLILSYSNLDWDYSLIIFYNFIRGTIEKYLTVPFSECFLPLSTITGKYKFSQFSFRCSSMWVQQTILQVFFHKLDLSLPCTLNILVFFLESKSRVHIFIDYIC